MPMLALMTFTGAIPRPDAGSALTSEGGPGESGSTGAYLVGRRPVVGPDLAVIGYRVVVSEGVITPTLMTRVETLEHLIGGAEACFLSLARPYLTGALDLPLPADVAVLEVDASVVDDPEVMDGLRRLIESGCRLSVFLGPDESVPAELLDMAHFIRLDFPTAPEGLAFRLAFEAEIGARVVLLSAHGARVIASGVNETGDLKGAREAGFLLFEGAFMSKPMKTVVHALTPSRVACFQMLQKVEDPESSAGDIERVVQTDPSLSYRLLHVSGLGAAGGMRREVRSIREATVLLGREWIHKWLLMMVVADANEGTAEQLTVAMIRARMSEILASAACPAETSAAFTVGVVSALDVLLGSALGDVVAKLAITADLKAALLQREGRLGAILDDVVSWIDWTPERPVEALRCGLDRGFAERAYLDALRFAAGVGDAMRGAEE